MLKRDPVCDDLKVKHLKTKYDLNEEDVRDLYYRMIQLPTYNASSKKKEAKSSNKLIVIYTYSRLCKNHAAVKHLYNTEAII